MQFNKKEVNLTDVYQILFERSAKTMKLRNRKNVSAIIYDMIINVERNQSNRPVY